MTIDTNIIKIQCNIVKTKQYPPPCLSFVIATTTILSHDIPPQQLIATFTTPLDFTSTANSA